MGEKICFDFLSSTYSSCWVGSSVLDDSHSVGGSKSAILFCKTTLYHVSVVIIVCAITVITNTIFTCSELFICFLCTNPHLLSNHSCQIWCHGAEDESDMRRKYSEYKNLKFVFKHSPWVNVLGTFQVRWRCKSHVSLKQRGSTCWLKTQRSTTRRSLHSSSQRSR